jgi:hypothetical protein
MSRWLSVLLLLAGLGCCGSGKHRCDVEPCCVGGGPTCKEAPPKGNYSAPPTENRQSCTRTETESTTVDTRAGVAQEVLLVPRTVYVPYTA